MNNGLPQRWGDCRWDFGLEGGGGGGRVLEAVMSPIVEEMYAMLEES